MNIVSRHARIDLDSVKSCKSFRISPCVSGYASEVSFIKGDFTVVHCRKVEEPMFEAIVILLSDEWLQDLKDSGYEVISVITSADGGSDE